jgi:hypothetical protein
MVSSAGDHDPSFSIAKCRKVYAKMLPSIKRHARIAFRSYSPDAKEEAVQNVLCNTWEALVNLARRGKLDQAFPSVLANFACRQTRDHRIVGGHLAINDILGKYCQVNKNVRVDRLDQYDPVADEWTQLVCEDKHAGPAEVACVRMDFADFLKFLPAKLRRIAKFLANGESTTAASKRFRVSAGRISQVRGELKNAWQRFQGEEPGGAAMAA